MGSLFSSTPKYNPQTDVPDLSGKVVLVTGGSGGIGYEAVAELARHGAKVYMGARNESKATGAIAKLKAEGVLDKGQVIWLKLDLSTPASAKAAAEEFMKRESRLDVLINNAALGLHPEFFRPVVESKVPVSVLMSTNHLGPFALTTTLLPLLKKTAVEPGSDVRVVMVSSAANNNAIKVSWKSADDWNFKSGSFMSNLGAYGATKTANILFAKELQRRFDEQGDDIVCLSLHPGSSPTPGNDKSMESWWIGRWVVTPIVAYTGLTVPQGGWTTVFAATAPIVKAEKAKYAGAYLTPYNVITEPSKEAQDPVAARDLWETSERLCSEM